MKNPTWPIVGIVALVAIIAGMVFAGNQQAGNNDTEMVNISGKVETVTPETQPVRIDFIRVTSQEQLSAQVNENGEYSTQLDPGRYRVELIHTTIGGIVSPLPGNCGTHLINSDNNNLNFRC